MNGTYYRWTQAPDGRLSADILGTETDITVSPDDHTIMVRVPSRPIDPDEARMVGVRLIEAAVLADAGRSTRQQLRSGDQ